MSKQTDTALAACTLPTPGVGTGDAGYLDPDEAEAVFRGLLAAYGQHDRESPMTRP